MGIGSTAEREHYQVDPAIHVTLNTPDSNAVGVNHYADPEDRQFNISRSYRRGTEQHYTHYRIPEGHPDARQLVDLALQVLPEARLSDETPKPARAVWHDLHAELLRSLQDRRARETRKLP